MQRLSKSKDGKIEAKRASGSKVANNPKKLASLKTDVILPNTLLDNWRMATLALSSPRAKTGEEPSESLGALPIDKLLEEYQGEIGGLWEAYNMDRTELHKFSLTRRRQAIAYLLAMHIPNTARMFGMIRRCLLRTNLNQAIAQAPSIKIIDLGCGGGALSLAWLHQLKALTRPDVAIEVDLVDVSRYLTESAALQMRDFPLSAPPTIRHCKIEDLFLQHVLTTRDPDTLLIVNMGYVLNEIERNRKARQVFGQLMQAIASRPALLCITEPAKQKPARDMMQLHDELLQFNLNPLYPCPNALPCPMLLKTRDWCFSEFSFKRPKEIAEIDHWLGRDTSQMATAGFIYASQGVSKTVSRKDAAMEVVVGRPLVKLAKKNFRQTAFQYLICTKGELLHYDKKQSDYGEILKRGEQFMVSKALKPEVTAPIKPTKPQKSSRPG